MAHLKNLLILYAPLVHALYKAEERSARLKDNRRLSTPQTAAGAPASRRISNLQQLSSQHVEPAGLSPAAAGMPVTTTAAVQTTGSVRVVAINGSGGGGNGNGNGRSINKRPKASSRRKSTDRTTRLLIVLLVLFLLTEFPQVGWLLPAIR